MRMTISKRKLSGFTDQPQKIPATILKSRMTFHLRKWERHSRSRILSGLWISSRFLLKYPLFNGDLAALATSQYLLERLSRNCTSPNGIRNLIFPLLLISSRLDYCNSLLNNIAKQDLCNCNAYNIAVHVLY